MGERILGTRAAACSAPKVGHTAAGPATLGPGSWRKWGVKRIAAFRDGKVHLLSLLIHQWQITPLCFVLCLMTQATKASIYCIRERLYSFRDLQERKSWRCLPQLTKRVGKQGWGYILPLACVVPLKYLGQSDMRLPTISASAKSFLPAWVPTRSSASVLWGLVSIPASLWKQNPFLCTPGSDKAASEELPVLLALGFSSAPFSSPFFLHGQCCFQRGKGRSDFMSITNR